MYSKFIYLLVVTNLLLAQSFCFGNDVKISAYERLDKLAIAAGTDKSSAYHNYTKVYSKYFDELREKNIKFMEIGIYQGDSVKLWESYFPNADLHFVDINTNNIKYFSTRSHYHYVDQANIPQMFALADVLAGNFDIIIDDGGHCMDQQINSFQVLFSQLKSGGMYIIEDLHTSYWKEYGAYGSFMKPLSGPGTCIDFLKQRIDDMNYTAAVSQCADYDKIPQEFKNVINYYQNNIDSIHFYQSVCIIFKK